MGPQTSRQNIGLGRAFHHLHGGAASWLRQAGPESPLRLDRPGTRKREEEAARAETKYPQDLDHRRRADQSLRKSRNRRRHGLAAHDQPASQSKLPYRRDDSERKHHRLDRSPDDYRG